MDYFHSRVPEPHLLHTRVAAHAAQKRVEQAKWRRRSSSHSYKQDVWSTRTLTGGSSVIQPKKRLTDNRRPGSKAPRQNPLRHLHLYTCPMQLYKW